MKYRILELSTGFYPQEKKCLFSAWEFIDNSAGFTIWCEHLDFKDWAKVSTYKEAIKVVEKRKQIVQDKKFKKIHNL